MKTIIIKTQEELNALPDSFDEFTVIEIRSSETVRVHNVPNSLRVEAYDSSRVVAYDSSKVVAFGSSRVEAFDSSRVVAYDSSKVVAFGSSRVEAFDSSKVVAFGSSRVEAWDSSSVSAYGASRIEAYQCATVSCYSQDVTIENLLDNSRLIYKTPNSKRPKQIDSTAIITEYEELVVPTFEQWLERGYVMADGILKKHKKTKQLEDGITLYEVFNDMSDEETSFAVTDGNQFAHGKTLRQAMSDLIFKKSERDSSKYRGVKIDQVFKTEDAIVMYRTITGACSQGVEEFLERNFKDKEEVSIEDIIKITEGHYGHEQFKNFGWV